MFVPITAGMKIDRSELSARGLNWGDNVPLELKNTWRENFEMIRKLGDIKFRRAIVPEDAVNLNLEVLEMADASEKLACVAIYGRFRLKSGSFSCQLLFAKSKLIPTRTGQ